MGTLKKYSTRRMTAKAERTTMSPTIEPTTIPFAPSRDLGSPPDTIQRALPIKNTINDKIKPAMMRALTTKVTRALTEKSGRLMKVKEIGLTGGGKAEASFGFAMAKNVNIVKDTAKISRALAKFFI